MEVFGTLVPVTSGEMGLGKQRNSGPWSDAVASCAPRSPGAQPAGEGVLGVSAAVVALSSAKRSAAGASQVTKNLRIASSNSFWVSHPALRAHQRAWASSDTGGQRRCCTSVSVYVGISTEQIVARSSGADPLSVTDESMGAAAILQ